MSDIPEYLLRDRLGHINMIESLRRGTGELVYSSLKGVLIYDKGGGCWLASAADPAESLKMLESARQMQAACVHQDFIARQLEQRYELLGTMECVQVAFLMDEPPAEPAGCEFRRLEPQMALWLNERYRNKAEDLLYVQELLEKGELIGAYVSGDCVGFVGRHSEGSMGLLTVLPEYRRLGIGTKLMQHMIRLEMGRGNVPYGHIIVGNAASLAMQKKLGASVAQGHVRWMDLGFAR